MSDRTSDVDVRTHIAAEPRAVYDLVSDLPRMGQWSPENTGGRWVAGEPGTVGARFRGSNRNGVRRWSTTVTVVEAEPGRRFSFNVDFAGVPISRWDYTFAATDGGTEVVESWTDRRPVWMKYGSIPAMGVVDRLAHNRKGMELTLAALKASAESAAGQPG